MKTDPETFILENTDILVSPHVPEIRLLTRRSVFFRDMQPFHGAKMARASLASKHR